MIAAGQFDRRITVQRATESRDPGTNAVLESWADHLVDVPAKVTQSAGREFLDSDKVTSERRAVFTVRGVPATVLDRVIFEGQTFNISDVRPLFRNRFSELQCEAIQ
ncbi:head-tail adaptor protein [Mesorhizobium sp. IMUNJ 23232]|uniref:head-tail adaptor protein n=1 Tax=Mesorhizobium sp. IMUNJ 23232 TaxID=3376064 RepID=UPI0037B2427E